MQVLARDRGNLYVCTYCHGAGIALQAEHGQLLSKAKHSRSQKTILTCPAIHGGTPYSKLNAASVGSTIAWTQILAKGLRSWHVSGIRRHCLSDGRESSGGLSAHAE